MISIIIPVFNEEIILTASIQKLKSFLSQHSEEFELLIISNGSTDNTDKIAAQLQENDKSIRFFSIPEKGVGTAFVKGVTESRGEFIISLDADLSSDLNFVEYSINLLKHADMVIGSKTMGKQRRTILRVLASQIYILFSQVLFDLTISDYSIGCKAYRKSSILGALSHLDNWTGYVFEICVYLRLKGAKTIQVGVDCDDRRRSHFNLLHEGFYRYYHLFKVWRKLKSRNSWFNT